MQQVMGCLQHPWLQVGAWRGPSPGRGAAPPLAISLHIGVLGGPLARWSLHMVRTGLVEGVQGLPLQQHVLQLGRALRVVRQEHGLRRWQQAAGSRRQAARCAAPMRPMRSALPGGPWEQACNPAGTATDCSCCIACYRTCCGMLAAACGLTGNKGAGPVPSMSIAWPISSFSGMRPPPALPPRQLRPPLPPLIRRGSAATSGAAKSLDQVL
jgi:hypothetical protein